MALAELGDTVGFVFAISVGIALLGLLCFVIVKVRRWFMDLAQRAVVQLYDDFSVTDYPAPGSVLVVFHTYSGLLLYFEQTEHRFWATPEEARAMLGRLHRFNLTWGLLAHCTLAVPLLSFGNYWAQRSRITKQESRLSI